MLKPLSYEKFCKELNRVLEQKHDKEGCHLLEQNKQGLYKIYFHDVRYIETSGKSTLIHTQNSDIPKPLCVLGLILILTGLSRRLNGGFLYVVMYDNFYFGMQEYLMDCIQNVDIKTLMDKDFYDDYRYCTGRSSSLTDLMSCGCMVIMKSISAVSMIAVAFSVSIPIGLIATVCFVVSVIVNFRLSSKLVIDTFQYRSLTAESHHYSEEMRKPGVAKEMRIYQNQENLLSKWMQAFQKVQAYDVDYDHTGLKLSSFVSGCLYLATFLMLALSIYQVVDGTQSVDVFLMLYLLGESLAETNKVFSSWYRINLPKIVGIFCGLCRISFFPPDWLCIYVWSSL